MATIEYIPRMTHSYDPLSRNDGGATVRQNNNLYLVHWNEGEAEDLAAPLKEQGWTITLLHSPGQFKLRGLRKSPPAALVISMRRLPSHGREIADAVWSSKWGREIPIIFFDSKREILASLQEKFPDARFTTWEGLVSILNSL
jgi:hypothetical protein